MNITKENDKSIYYGSLITAALIAFFFVMQAAGLIHNFTLRALNGVFVFAGIFLAVKQHRDATKEIGFRTLNALSVGLKTAFLVAISFASFVAIYLLLNESFMAEVKELEPQGQYMNPFTVSIVIFIEAMASGALFAYISMQYFKVNNQAKADTTEAFQQG